ncbi:hypothetical protein HGP14_30295 [Rhizobium sp. P32RR-XVIII]|nr:hypothetical protein [Rhizobium sp. P32RR-XVIII]
MVNEHYRFAEMRSNGMRIVNTLRVALTGLALIGAVSAYAQMDKRSQYEGSAATVVDDKGNLRVPFDYRTAYR